MTEQSFVKDVDPSVSPAEAAAWGGFLYTHAKLIQQLDVELQEAHQLSFSSFEVLFLLAGAPERRLRMLALAGSTLLSPSGVSRLVDRLAAEGIVERERSSQDRREQYARLTEKGLHLLRAAYRTHLTGVRKYFFNHLSEQELNIMAALWERLIPGASHHYSHEIGTLLLEDGLQ